MRRVGTVETQRMQLLSKVANFGFPAIVEWRRWSSEVQQLLLIVTVIEIPVLTQKEISVSNDLWFHSCSALTRRSIFLLNWIEQNPQAEVEQQSVTMPGPSSLTEQGPFIQRHRDRWSRRLLRLWRRSSWRCGTRQLLIQECTWPWSSQDPVHWEDRRCHCRDTLTKHQPSRQYRRWCRFLRVSILIDVAPNFNDPERDKNGEDLPDAVRWIVGGTVTSASGTIVTSTSTAAWVRLRARRKGRSLLMTFPTQLNELMQTFAQDGYALLRIREELPGKTQVSIEQPQDDRHEQAAWRCPWRLSSQSPSNRVSRQQLGCTNIVRGMQSPNAYGGVWAWMKTLQVWKITTPLRPRRWT